MAAADAAADALLAAGGDECPGERWKVHYRVTPRSRATSSRVRSSKQALDGGLDQVDRVGAAVHLGQDVVDAAAFQHVADAGAGLDAGARAGRDQDHPAAAELADDAVRDGLALHLDFLLALQGFLGVLDGLFDGGRHFVGLAVAPGDPAALVADHDQGVEAEAPAALDHGGATANLDDPFFQPVLRGFHDLWP